MIDSKVFGKIAEGSLLERMKHSPQWQGSSFRAMHKEPNLDIMASISGEYLRSKRSSRLPHKEIPVLYSKASELSVISESLRLMWLGHAGIMIEYAGLRLLLDPIFSERPSPIQWGGPAKRFHPAPFNARDLESVNAVIISHNHYDHLDMASIKELAPIAESFIVPLGLSPTLIHWGVSEEKCVDLDWTESKEINEIKITAVDAKHYSGRGFSDRNMSLWCGYLIEIAGLKILFTGDSGYTESYKRLGEEYGPIDLLIPGIGAYHKLWWDNHKFPEEAWQAHSDFSARKTLPVHWGTFDLAMHSWNEPVSRLVKAAGGLTDLFIPKVGEWIDMDYVTMDSWWV